MTRLEVPPGGRWHAHLLHAYRSFQGRASIGNSRDGYKVEDAIASLLDDPETRRIVVDAEQVARFLDVQQPPEALPVRFPFDQCYIELSTPLDGIEQIEDEYEDSLVAFVVKREEAAEFGRVEDRVPAWMVSALFVEGNGDRRTWSDAGFGLRMDNGLPFTRVSACLEGVEPSIFPDAFLDGLRGKESETFITPRTEGEGIGRWERRVSTIGTLVRWLAAYLTAKGIVIVDEVEAGTMTRQQRRALARAKHRPRPWHVVMVDPTRLSDEERGAGRGHGFRYDVRGHLRFGRHKRSDGTYSQTVEWVRPHQRGIRHATYVPKTYGYDDRSPRPAIAE